MRYEDIEKFMTNKTGNPTVEIRFKTRQPVRGMFIKTADYTELSRKNLWRIVSERSMESFNKSKDLNLSRIFNGAEFTKLEQVK
jgi:hypothetical protein